jgi:5-hydroxyisourate hydrolase
MGQLTTHVLDIAQGHPAAGLDIELWRIGPDSKKTLLTTTQTNRDGRTDQPLLSEGELVAGVYELVFAVGPYFRRQGTSELLPQGPPGTALPFLNRVPVQFGIGDPMASYHVPLLVSPWAYSTYRGS